MKITLGEATPPNIPSFLVPNPDEIVDHEVAFAHLHIRWWEKLLRRTLEKKALKWINEVKLEFQEKSTPEFERLRETFGL